MSDPGGTSKGSRTASMVTLGFVILAAGHLLMYLLLTADARSGIADGESARSVAQLESAKDPGFAPEPGSEAYSVWLGSYETWWASKDYALHSRHESMVKIGMLLSFLVGLGLLAAGCRGAATTSARRVRPRRIQAGGRTQPARRIEPVRPARPAVRAQPARRPARVVPLRPVPAVAARPAAVRPVAVRPVAVQRRRSA